MQKTTEDLAVLSQERILEYIVNNCLQKDALFLYDMTDSTNTRAREYAACGFDGAARVFIAEGQYAGRGRRGKTFDSERGAGLYISFLLKPKGAMGDITAITAEAAVKVCRAVESVCDVSLGIKWVNDIFVNGKKLAGILTEGEFDSERGELSYIVCGIGINLKNRNFPEEISKIATSVEEAAGAMPDINLLAARIISEFLAESSSVDYMNEYRARSTVVGRRVEVRRLSGEIFFATADSITDTGALTVIREDGAREELISAEVSLRCAE